MCLVTFLDVPTWNAEANQGLDLIEFFAGKARVSRMASWVGYKVRSFDIAYAPNKAPGEFKRGKLSRSAMDLNGCAGFVLLGLWKLSLFKNQTESYGYNIDFAEGNIM